MVCVLCVSLYLYTFVCHSTLFFYTRVPLHHRTGLHRALTYAQLCRLLDRLVRTGHVNASSLPRRTQLWPPLFAPPSTEEMASHYFQAFQLDPSQDVISQQQFKRETLSLTRARYLSFWYLENMRLGMVKKFRLRWSERVLRVYNEWQGVPPCGVETDPSLIDPPAEA